MIISALALMVYDTPAPAAEAPLETGGFVVPLVTLVAVWLLIIIGCLTGQGAHDHVNRVHGSSTPTEPRATRLGIRS